MQCLNEKKKTIKKKVYKKEKEQLRKREKKFLMYLQEITQ